MWYPFPSSRLSTEDMGDYTSFICLRKEKNVLVLCPYQSYKYYFSFKITSIIINFF